MYSRRGRFHFSKRGRGNSSWVRSKLKGKDNKRPLSINSAVVHRSWKRKQDDQDSLRFRDAKEVRMTQSDPSKLIENELSDNQEAAVTNKLSDGHKTMTPLDSINSNNQDDVVDSNVADQMHKIGKNKLVLTKDLAKASTDKNKSLPIVEVDVTNMHKYKYGKGKHKLVLKKEYQESKSLETQNVDALSGAATEGMRTTGHNKLVSEARYLQDEEQWKERVRKRRIESRRGRVSHHAKRVKLTDMTKKKVGEVTEQSTSSEKLSDFAYQKISKQRGRAKQSMSLVRIANAEDAPICSTFVRGLPCTNPHCTKRHDVTIEAATPICSFFQRSGQCLRRDTCPFRHIKVNPHAMVCPSFSLLGYCENEDCVMKHIRFPKTRGSEPET